MARYHCIAVLIVALFECSRESQKLQNAILYIIQPPPELPCNPFIREEYYYGNLALQCYVAVSKVFLKHTEATISLVLFYNQTDEHNRNYIQKIIPRMNVFEEDSFIIYTAVHSVEGILHGRDEYWCQVFVNEQQVYESYIINPSSVTVIRNPSCYHGFPPCTENIPLGLPVILDAFSHPLTLDEFCTDTAFEASSSELVLNVNDPVNGTISCNETASSDDYALPSALIIVPNVILSVIVVLAAIVLISVLVVYWRHKKPLKYRMKDMSDVVVTRKPYMDTSGYAKQLHGACSLPDLRTSNLSSCISDIPDTTASLLHIEPEIHTGKNYYEGIPSSHRGTVDDEMGRTRDSTESYSYVTPNLVKFPVKRAKAIIVNDTTSKQPPPLTQPGMYLTLMDSVKQQQPHRTTIPDTSKDPSYDGIPIYDVVQELA